MAHQSNDQSDPLSRNRVDLGAGFERGDGWLTDRVKQRLNEPVATDSNPDLVTGRGRAEFQLGWAHGLRWFVQAFRGCGETLTDYNLRQTSIGAGVRFLQF